MNKEKEILELCLSASTQEEGYRLLVENYQESIYRIIRQMVLNHEDTNDLMQDVFIKIWKYLPNFKQDSSLFTWIYRIATNHTLNFLKKKKRKYMFLLKEYNQEMIERLSSDPYFDGDEAEIKLQNALLKLPEKQRLAFNMHYFEDMKFSEIEKIVGTSSGALRASYHIAVKKIKKELVGE